MLNMRCKSGLATIIFAVLLTACAGSPVRESSGEYFDDTAITTKVKIALLDDKQVNAFDIKVETFKGVVQLSGFTDTRSEVERATQVARNVPGVKSVRNDIALKPGAVSLSK